MTEPSRDERALVERLREIARTVDVYEPMSQVALLDEAAAALTSFSEQVETLKDPVVVHANMLRGVIAKPSWAQIKHLYPEEFAAAERRLAEVTALLDSCPCPRPANGDPYDTTISQCNALGHCGCVYSSAIRARSDEGRAQDVKEG